MIYFIDMFNVEFLIFVRNEKEKYIMDIWWKNFITTPEMGRVSVVLDFLQCNNLEFKYRWSYCSKLSGLDNLKAYIGFRRQIKNYLS